MLIRDETIDYYDYLLGDQEVRREFLALLLKMREDTRRILLGGMVADYTAYREGVGKLVVLENLLEFLRKPRSEGS
jgi:hypothetical protein